MNCSTNWRPVAPSTRAGSSGKLIQCPNCNSIRRIYHFSWSALQCSQCNTMVDKYDWNCESHGHKHNLAPQQVDAIVESHLLKREKRRAYQKNNWAQINLRLRIGSDTLIQLDKVRGDISRLAYVQSLVEQAMSKHDS